LISVSVVRPSVIIQRRPERGTGPGAHRVTMTRASGAPKSETSVVVGTTQGTPRRWGRRLVQVVAGVLVTGVIVGTVEVVCGFFLRFDGAPQMLRAVELPDTDAVSSMLAQLDTSPAPLVTDAKLLWRNQPLASRTQPVNPRSYGHDDTWSIQINSEGFRGPERPFKRESDNVYRILCIGDSVTFGFNTDQSAPFARQLEERLEAQYPRQRFEVINAGVPGWSWVQGRRFLELDGLTLQPNLIIVAYGSNDQYFHAKITDNERLEHARSFLGRAAQAATGLLSRTNTYRAWLKIAGPEGPQGNSLECEKQIREAGSCRRVSTGDIATAIEGIDRFATFVGMDLIVLNLDFMRTAVGAPQDLVDTAPLRFVDFVAQFDELRREDENERAQRLGLLPAQPMRDTAPAGQPSAGRRVLPRVWASNSAAGLSIRGLARRKDDPTAGYGFDEPLYDDGTHGDEVANDRVFSATIEVPPDSDSMFYRFYLQGVPELEPLPPMPSSMADRLLSFDRDVIAPVAVFGEQFLMADRVHPNARGHEIIARHIAELLPSVGSFQQFVSDEDLFE
jgi:lysophospholipase L1-like esterase